MFCDQCGAEQPADARFCDACGTPLEVPAATAPAAMPDREPATEPAPSAEPRTPGPAPPDGAPEPEAPPPEPAEAATAPASRRRLGPVAKVSLVVLLLLVVAVAGGAWWLFKPQEAAAFSTPIDNEAADRNSIIYGALVSLGIDEPFVDVTTERVFVAYDVEASPSNASYLAALSGERESSVTVVDPDDLNRYIIGTVAEAAPTSDAIVIDRFDRQNHRVTWRVGMDDVVAFFEGDLTVAAFEATIDVSADPPVDGDTTN